MWTTFLPDDVPYTPRSTFIAQPAAAPHATSPEPGSPPKFEMSAEEWNALLLTTLAPFRDAREALVKALTDKRHEQERRHGLR